MPYHGVLTREAFADAIQPEHVRISRFIQLAIVLGPLVFMVMVMAMALQRQTAGTPGQDAGFLWPLTIVHLAYAVGAFLAGHLVSDRFFTADRLAGDPTRESAETLVLKCIGLRRTALIVRLALMESAAFFGLVVCLLAVFNGLLPDDTKYWINLASTVFLVVYGLVTLPTKERLAGWFEQQFLR